jgi:hypothetical protein
MTNIYLDTVLTKFVYFLISSLFLTLSILLLEHLLNHIYTTIHKILANDNSKNYICY